MKRVGIIMGSDSDLRVMQAAADTLKEFGVEFELTIVSAHRTPDRMMQYARSAAERGLQSHHRRRGWRRTCPHGRLDDDPAGDWCPGKHHGLSGPGQCSEYPADAQRHSGRDGRD